MKFLLREAWNEFRAGLRGGVLPLIYLVLTGYLLIVLSRADYLSQMGATDIPRNAPALVYLMTSGDTFFLLFAWAWLFAQPIVRDRSAYLHEVVLSMPVDLRALLAARYLGALGVALVLGSSQIAGFLAAPLLEWIGAIPPGSLAPPPWMAFGWATLVFTLPLAAGAGALYFIAAIRSRNVAGPLAVAAALMAFWMVSMIVLKGNHADQFLATVLDPSAFAEAEHQVVDNWTPQQKASALLELSPALIWNRLLWCALPLLALTLVVLRARRQTLVLGREPALRKARRARGQDQSRSDPVSASPLPAVTRLRPWRAATCEALWQVRRVLAQRWLWVCLPLLVLLAILGAYVHGVQYAYGPLVPRPEMVMPLLRTLFYLIIVFMLAGMVGVAARRDDQSGMGEMFDAAPMPPWVRVLGRCAAALACAVLLTLVPALGGIGVGVALALGDIAPAEQLVYQGLTLLPALLEVTALTLLIHALIRRAGPAYAASMLVAFILIVNHETRLVAYPPYQIGQAVEVEVSGLTGLWPWLDKLLIGDGFKIALVAVAVTLAVLVLPVGTDRGARVRLRAVAERLRGGAGIALGLGLVAMAGFDWQLHQSFVVEGDFKSREQTLAEDAAWERRWLGSAGPVQVDGGELELLVDPPRRVLHGHWQLRGVRSADGWLHAELPHGLQALAARIDGQPRKIVEASDHVAIELGDCARTGCRLELRWQVSARGWSAEGRPPWLTARGYWLRPAEVMPRLGFDTDRILRSTADRARFGLPSEPRLPSYAAALSSGAAAPAGAWQWRLRGPDGYEQAGATTGLLDFAGWHSPAAQRSGSGSVEVVHDSARASEASGIADDLRRMQACLVRRLGGSPAVTSIVQWPRGLGDSVLAGHHLLLAEDPHWDVAAQGVGRYVRRANIAAALARRWIRDRADLHDGPAAGWFDRGLPFAIGMACVAESDGIEALSALLTRGADQVNQALATADVPIDRLDRAQSEGWADEYLPLAALDQTLRLSPDQLDRWLAELRRSQDAVATLQAVLGSARAQVWMGAPWAADVRAGTEGVDGRRWRWLQGGWQAAEGAAPTHGWRVHAGRLLEVQGMPTAADALYLDDWPGYERAPADNRASAGR